MSTLFLADALNQPLNRRAQHDQANSALRRVLDAEIEALEARLRQRSAIAAVTNGSVRADLDQQVAWLRDSLAKLQARRDALRCARR